jgi:hypothetical protein
MWMDSSFASWEVEGQVRERVSNALRNAEQGRLLRPARDAKTGRVVGDWLNQIKAALWSGNLPVSRLRVKEPTL